MKYFLFALALLTLPALAFAQETGFVPLTNTPFIEQAGNAVDLPNMLNQLYRLCIGIAAVVAVLQIMRAGIMYMGGDSVTEKKEAKNLIALSIGGLVLVLSPVIVFSVINPDILSLKIGGIENLRTQGTGTTTQQTASTTQTGGGGSGQSCPTAPILIASNGICPNGHAEMPAACVASKCSGMTGGKCCYQTTSAQAPANQPANYTPTGPQRFKMAYKDVDFLNSDPALSGRECVTYIDRTLPSLETCQEAEIETGTRLTADEKEFIFVKRCINNELPRHRFMDLPTCAS
ncbi:MAG TPA: pilin [Candidatus Paceibacterota bacterium]